MAIIGNFRKTSSAFVVVVISFFVVMFLGSDLARLVPYFFQSRDRIGTLSGQTISATDYYKLCHVMRHNYKKKGEQLKEDVDSYIKDYAWRYVIERMLYSKELASAGILVGPQELVDLVQGEHIDEEILASFKDPETGTFDKQALLRRLQAFQTGSKSEREWWCENEKKIALKRAQKKLNQLMVKSCFVTTSEVAQAADHAALFCNVDYFYIPFISVKDDLVPLTNQDLRNYMAAHAHHYKALSESRVIKYITFPIEPDKKDSSDFQKELDSLVAQFSTTNDPYAFAQQHTDGNLAATKLVCTVDTLPDVFNSIKHTLKEGMIVGPVVNDQVHTLYKLIKETKANYEIASIQKKQSVSDHTRNKYLSHLQDLTREVKKNSDLEPFATNHQLTIHQDSIAPSDGSIGPHVTARNVVRWLYGEAKLGKVSPIFDVGNAYLLAVMVDQVKAGDLVPLDSVFQEVYAKVLHQEKAKIILDKLKQLDAPTLQGMAEQYGEGAKVESLERLCFLENDHLENDHPYLKQSQAFIGHCFGLQLNVISQPIVDKNGIFIACVKTRDKQVPAGNHDQEMNKMEQLMQPYCIKGTMEELQKVTDERYKFE